MRKHRTEDPMENLIAEALISAGVRFTAEGRKLGRPQTPDDITLDFHLPDLDVWIEVKQFHSDRIVRQMAQAPNVIVAQGRPAVEALAKWIRGAKP